MSNSRITCDPQRIELFLEQKLSDLEQAAFQLHLDDCDDCRRQLEAAAAGDQIWADVRDSLRGQQLPPDSLLCGDSALDSAAGGDASFGHAAVLKLLAPTDDDRMLGRLGKYEVVGVIGSGGMGVVLKAFDAALNRYVAIKVLAPHLGSSGAARKRFSREAQAAAAVVHDNVMEIHGVADVEGLPYLVMPYVRGPSLQHRLDSDGPLALVEILRIGMQAAAGLAAAHAQGLVHRDVKPANILLADGVERVKLTDFGLARAADDASLTKTGIIAGTPQFMSPEQARGESVDQRSDLFSLGSVLYAMCTGRSPFRAETSYGVLRRVTDDEPRPIREINPEIPEWLCQIITRLMSKQPQARFGSAREVADLLEQCLAHVQQPTAVPLPASLVPRSRRNRLFSNSRLWSGVIVMIAALGLGLLGIFLWPAAEDPEPSKSPSTAGGQAAEVQPAAPQPKATEAMPRRVHQFANLTTGHNVKIACSPDGKRIAIANANPTIVHETSVKGRAADNWKPVVHILDSDTGKIVVSLKLTTADEDAVLAATERITHIETTALAFSPDGNLLAVGTSIGQLKLFSTLTGEVMRSLDDEKAMLADKETPENWKSLKRAIGSVGSLAFSPDGSLLAMCGGSFADFSERFGGVMRMGFRMTGPGRLKLWDVQTGSLKHDLIGHNDQAYAVAFSPDGKFLASAGRWATEGEFFGNGVIVWNAQTGEAIHKLIRTTAAGGARAIAFSPDSKLLAMGTWRAGDGGPDDPSTGGVSLIHASSGIEEWLVTVPGWAGPVAFSPDGKSVVVLCGGGSIRYLETATGILKHEIKPAEGAQAMRWDGFAIAREGDTLAISGVSKDVKGGVEVWSTKSDDQHKAPAAAAPAKSNEGVPKERSFKTRESVKTIACSEDGNLVAFANGNPTMIMGENGTSRVKDNWKPSVEILDARTGNAIAVLKLTTADEDAILAATPRLSHFEVTALAFSPDGKVAAVGTSIGQVKLYDARTGELLRLLDDQGAKLADQKTPENWKSLERAMGSIASLTFSPDGSQLATCGGSFGDFSRVFEKLHRLGERSTGPGRLKIWDVKTETLKHNLIGHSHASAVAFSPDTRVLASAGSWLSDAETGTGVVIWNAQNFTKLRTVSIEANGGTESVAFSLDGKLIAISSRHFDKDKVNDPGASIISLANVASGVVQWRQTVPGSAKPVAFQGVGVLVLCDGQEMVFLELKTGEELFGIHRSANPRDGGLWNDFVLAKQGRMEVRGGQDPDGKGTVQVLDPDRP